MRVSDWSSDVCSSDLLRLETVLGRERHQDDDVDDRALVIVRPGQGQSYALSVAAIHDQEELVIKPAAPMIMATGLSAGTTLPDNEIGRASSRERVCQDG